MEFEDVCNTGLVLGLGFSPTQDSCFVSKPKKLPNSSTSLEPCLTLSLSSDQINIPTRKIITIDVNKVSEEPNSDFNYRQASDHSAVSSFSTGHVKRERDLSSEDIEVEKLVSSRISDEDEDASNARKKLRLTKDQSALLEESFKQHSTLNPKQKQALARQLNLRPRQVEVWFQNRRARTKLKQTEVDCEFLKKCCEKLTDENRRLQKEVQELKALKVAQPFYMHMPAATLTMCPSCERIGGGGGGVAHDTTSTKSPFSMAPKSHFYNSFTNPSAAC